jgi:hypothetical protein
MTADNKTGTPDNPAQWTVRDYPRRWRCVMARKAMRLGISPSDAEAIHKRLDERTAYHILYLLDNERQAAAFKKVLDYDIKYGISDIELFILSGADPESVDQYPAHIHTQDRCFLSEVNIPGHIAKHYVNMTTDAIHLAYLAGITPDRRDFAKKMEEHKEVLERIGRDYELKLWLREGRDELEVIGIGHYGIVFGCGNFAAKDTVFEMKEAEIRNLAKIAKYCKLHHVKFSNVVTPSDPGDVDNKWASDHLIILPKIGDKTLTKLVEQRPMDKPIENASTLHYAACVLNGLREMRLAKLNYHNDLKPGNIIITPENNAVIIDLAFATRGPPGQLKNRGFRGPSDLSSLGQIMYWAATGGEHVFKEGIAALSDSLVLDDIADERFRSYAEQDGLVPYLKKIDDKLARSSPEIADITKLLLASGVKENDYERAWVVLEKYYI